jgi:hypothetical protein
MANKADLTLISTNDRDFDKSTLSIGTTAMNSYTVDSFTTTATGTFTTQGINFVEMTYQGCPTITAESKTYTKATEDLGCQDVDASKGLTSVTGYSKTWNTF